MTSEVKETAGRRLRALAAIRWGIARDVRQCDDFLRMAEGIGETGNGVKTQRSVAAIQADIPYWQDKKAILERMIVLLDQSKAANEALLVGTESAGVVQ